MTATENLFYILLWVIGTCVAMMAGVLVSDYVVSPFLDWIDKLKESDSEL